MFSRRSVGCDPLAWMWFEAQTKQSSGRDGGRRFGRSPASVPRRRGDPQDLVRSPACGAGPRPSRSPAPEARLAAAQALLSSSTTRTRRPLCGSPLMPQPYEVRGGYRATFQRRGARIHDACRAHRPRSQHPDRVHRRWGACHRPPRHQPLRGDGRPCAGLASTTTPTTSQPDSVLSELELTLSVHQLHTQPVS
jgi:hypothetical protein